MADDSKVSRPQNTAPPEMAGFFGGLSGKLLVLTILFVLLAEVLIFVPSVANTRLRWLKDRLSTAAAASVVIDAMPKIELPRPLQDNTLMATGTKAIVLEKDKTRHMIAVADMPPQIDKSYDLTNVGAMTAMMDAFDTLFFGANRYIRVMGPVADSDLRIEVVLAEGALRDAMLVYARNVALLSLIISLITATLIFLAINRILIRPIRRMTMSMQDFSESPEDPSRILVPEPGKDELALAGHHLAEMQGQLQKTLKQQKNLADLGLAVSKINHDLRNILASAQLMSDRLADVDDPVVKRFAPKLLRTIDRAVAYTTAVLSYGRATEPAPNRRTLKLKMLAEDVWDLMSIDTAAGIEFQTDIDENFEIEADSDQLFRVIHNLVRNAAEALMQDKSDDRAVVRRITVSATRQGRTVQIHVDDTGPGMPKRARENLFTAFRGSVKAGGTGLGLAIARELVAAHGGTIALLDKATPGTCFVIDLPDPAPAKKNGAAKH